MIKQLLDIPHERRLEERGVCGIVESPERFPQPVNIEREIEQAYHNWQKAEDGTRQRNNAFRMYKLRLETYHAIFGRRFVSEPSEPMDWMDNLGAIG
jgi:hypothetical protein